jgi:hypothetical protein
MEFLTEEEYNQQDPPAQPIKKRKAAVKDEKPALPRAVNMKKTQHMPSSNDPVKEAFMAAPLFHLNSFMNGGTKRNKAFGPFIREQVATPGFYEVDAIVHDMVKEGASQDAVRQEILRRGAPDGFEMNASVASQVALWLREAKVGSYVLMRHEYKNCPWVPSRLKDDQGKYIGKVLVLGIVTEVIEPYSAEERAIAASLPEIANDFSHTFCRVQFNKMIMKSTLQPATIKYISAVCQKTVGKICVDGGEWPSLGTDSVSVREDLWSNATISITGQEFNETFGTDEDMFHV